MDFLPARFATEGLWRPASPMTEIQLERYHNLIYKAIPNTIVQPLDQQWVDNTLCLVPQPLRKDYKEHTRKLTDVCRLVSYSR